MKQFQRLMAAALLCGSIAGTFLFLYQYVVVVPRIVAAEAFEPREPAAADEHHHDRSEWQPNNGLERNFFTAASTILTGISFAALLISAITLGGFRLDVRLGLLWGVAGFVCFTVAPALGLPPEPPGAPAADIRARQLWWVLTAGITAIGLMLIFGSRRGWVLRVVGAILLILPHAIGAPQAIGPQVIPASLVRDFAIASIAGNGLFWLVLGTLMGFLFPMEPEVRVIQR